MGGCKVPPCELLSRSASFFHLNSPVSVRIGRDEHAISYTRITDDLFTASKELERDCCLISEPMGNRNWLKVSTLVSGPQLILSTNTIKFYKFHNIMSSKSISLMSCLNDILISTGCFNDFSTVND